MGCCLAALCDNGGTAQSKHLMVGLDGSGKTCILHRIQTGQFIKTRIEHRNDAFGEEAKFQLTNIMHQDETLIIWDASGHDRYRGLWKTYLYSPSSIIFVVDSADEYRLGDYNAAYMKNEEKYKIWALRMLIDGFLRECMFDGDLQKIPFEIQIMCMDYIGKMAKKLVDYKVVQEFYELINDDQFRNVKVLVLANKQDLSNALSIDIIQERLGLNKMGGRRWNIIGCSAKTGEGLQDAIEWIC